MSEELRFHFEREVEKYVRSGLTYEEASRQARLAFGGFDQVQEDCRDVRGVSVFETTVQDVRYGLRVLRKKPGFTVIAVLTLALGIGTSTAVFSAVDTILLKPLPYVSPEKVVMLWWKAPILLADAADEFPWGKKDFARFSQEATTFQSLGAFKSDFFNLVGAGEPVRLDGLRASAGFFPALGVAPELGRTFSPDEDQPGHELEVILSDELWRDRFGSDMGIVGRAITLNDRSYIVVGVMPRGFAFPRAEEMPASLSFPARVQLWVPLDFSAGSARGPQDLAVIGRLNPSATAREAGAELRVHGDRMVREFPDAKGWYNPNVVSLTAQIVGDTEGPLLLLLGAVGIVLLIACANVASLVITRTLGRWQEFTLRAALGAGRARLVRQLVTESLLLAGLGGAAGILLANVGLQTIKILGPSNVPRLGELQLDFPVLLFATGTSFIAAILFGLTPAIGMPRPNLVQSLNEGGQRSSGGAAHAKIRATLLVAEVALALVLVIATGLLMRTFYDMLAADPGFNPTRVLTFQLSLPSSKYSDPDRMAELYQKALRALEAVPGVQSAGLVSEVPMGGSTDSTVIRVPDHPRVDGQEHPYVNYSFASPGYFAAIGTSLLRGRDFLDTDIATSTLVTVINKAMAAKYWPGQNAIGRQVGVENPRWPTRTVVGIVADIKHASLREDPEPEMYVPYTQNEIKVWPSMTTMQIALRSKIDPGTLTTSARAALQLVDPDLPMSNVATLQTLVDNSLAQSRFSLFLVGSFGGLALVLATIGMYGVISYSVQLRTREIGIRMAMGATRRDVLRMVLGSGARLVALGLAIGLVMAWLLTRTMAKFLYGIRPTDPLTFMTVTVLLISVAVLACFLPARCATRIDPLVALRYE